MIIYRKSDQIVGASSQIDRLYALASRLKESSPITHEEVVELLITYSEFETGITDSYCAERDSARSILRVFREAGLSVGHIFFNSWEKRPREALRWIDAFLCGLKKMCTPGLPKKIRVRVQEGYAYYGLYPETYLEAAELFFRALRPHRVACIGVRSIGVGLSAVVGAALQEHGCEVVSYTVRPRGHPFYRRILLTPKLEELFKTLHPTYFVVVDEGPGLSGSSICSVARTLADLGIPDSRIILFPSWEPDGKGFVSETARDCWHKHRKFSVNFKQTWLGSGRLGEAFPGHQFYDISAGNWRPLFYDDVEDYPAVHAHHERWKFVCSRDITKALNAITRRNNGNSDLSGVFFLKFTGLGQYGKQKFNRALNLADAGFSHQVLELANGFLVAPFIQGKPLAKKGCTEELLLFIARYLTHLRNDFPVVQKASSSTLSAMIRINTGLALGKEWAERLDFLDAFRVMLQESTMVAIDGRMLPHEFLLTRNGYVKTDSVDHHSDEFLPGCHDIAWDLAGTIVEFSLNAAARKYLLEHYAALAYDNDIYRRVPYYIVAYLACRLGHVTFAAKELCATMDGQKFNSLKQHYTALLAQGIQQLQKGKPGCVYES